MTTKAKNAWVSQAKTKTLNAKQYDAYMGLKKYFVNKSASFSDPIIGKDTVELEVIKYGSTIDELELLNLPVIIEPESSEEIKLIIDITNGLNFDYNKLFDDEGQ